MRRLKSTRFRSRSAPINITTCNEVGDGDRCVVVAGTHKGKSGTVRDKNVSKTGAVTITVVEASGARFKTLAKNVTKTRQRT